MTELTLLRAQDEGNRGMGHSAPTERSHGPCIKRQCRRDTYLGRLLDLESVKIDLFCDFDKKGRYLNFITVARFQNVKTPIKAFYSSPDYVVRGLSSQLAGLVAKGELANVLVAVQMAFSRLVDSGKVDAPYLGMAPLAPKRRSRVTLEVPPHCDDVLWKHIVRRDKASCVCCLKALAASDGPTLHHLLPRSQGGRDDAENQILVCRRCHDRVEDAQEAALLSLGKPPRRSQYVGIFAESEPSEFLPTVFERPEWHALVYGGARPCSEPLDILPEQRTKHAARVIASYPVAELQHLSNLAKAWHRWSHVNWHGVARIDHTGLRKEAPDTEA